MQLTVSFTDCYPAQDLKKTMTRTLGWLLLLLTGIGIATAETSVRREPAPEQAKTRNYEPSKTHDPVIESSCKPRTNASVFEQYERALPTGGEGKRVVRLDIHETIDLGLAPFLKRVLDEAASDPSVALVLIHMDTPGGRLDAAQQIKDALLKSTVPTATFIDTHALSAGAFIAYATDFIVVTDGSTIGAATPINVGQGGQAQPVGEKFVSAVRAMFRATAEAKGRDGRIAESMVDSDVEIPGIIDEGKLLTLAKEEAIKHCVADFEANDIPAILSKLNLSKASVDHPKLNWAERIARFLTGPVVSSLLMTFGFLGLMMELYSPGFGVAGSIGLACLTLFFTGHLIVDLVGAEEIVLVAVGVVLIGVEVFVTPGFGFIGALGVGALVVGMTLAMVGSDIGFSWDAGLLGPALMRVAIAGIFTIVLLLIAVRMMPGAPLLNRLVLEEGIDDIAHMTGNFDDMLHQTGTALTPISGSGKARIGDTTFDVVGEGAFIEKGAKITVVRARAGRIVVSKKEA